MFKRIPILPHCKSYFALVVFDKQKKYYRTRLQFIKFYILIIEDNHQDKDDMNRVLYFLKIILQDLNELP